MRRVSASLAILLLLPLGVFAAVNSVKVSGDITSTAVARDFSLGAGGNDDASDFIATQVRLRVDAALTEGVNAVIRFINERLWGEETTDTDIDLDLAYLEMKEFFSPVATLIVGRQNLHYGSGLIVGDPDTNRIASSEVPTIMSDLSLRKSFDAARLILDYSPYMLDLIYAKVSEGDTNVNDDVTLFGANLSYAWNSYNGLTNVYFFGSDNARGVNVQDEKSKTYVVGASTQLSPNDHLVLSGEAAYQFGDYAGATSHAHLSAWALELSATYRFLNEKNGQIGFFYAYLSGDDTSSKSYNGWDPMFEDQVPAEIINILFAHSNCQLFSINGSFMPREDLTVGALYAKAFLAEKLSAGTYIITTGPAVGGESSTATYTVKSGKKELGDELDVFATYDYTEDVQFKLTGAWFEPGSWFASSNDESAYSLKGSVKVAF